MSSKIYLSMSSGDLTAVKFLKKARLMALADWFQKRDGSTRANSSMVVVTDTEGVSPATSQASAKRSCL